MGLSPSSAVSSPPPTGLRGKRGRRSSSGSSSEASNPEPVEPFTSFLQPTTRRVARLRKKRQRRAAPSPLWCAELSHYNACVSGCQETCSSLDAAGTCGICEERCECDDGFLLSGGTCVLEEDCGCWVNEQHYAIRETFMEGDCNTLCECQGHGKIHCSPVSCLAGEVCMVQDGIKGCFPSSPVTCSVYGDPHYITFDGKACSFWGTCNYTIVKTCGPANTQFTLTARNEGRENPTSSSLNSVALDMEGFHLTIRKNKLVYVSVLVCSQLMKCFSFIWCLVFELLPCLCSSWVTLTWSQAIAFVQENRMCTETLVDFYSQSVTGGACSWLSKMRSGPYAQVDTDFGVRLVFDGSSRLFVQVDERYRGMLCGLCGTYSGICGLNCDFESDICSWTQLLTDVFDWTRQIGSTPTLKTGPSSDHTTGSGYYIYIEGDSATHGDTARLLSAECTDIQPQCLQFWYHMHGASSTMGLSVYQFEGNLTQEVWRRRDNHGDMWHHALVDLRPTVKFHVIFEGRRGSTALSDVAINDVSLHRGTCDDLVNQVKPTTPGPLPPTVHTTARPIQTTSASVETTSRPTQTTAEPVQTSTRPVQTTAEPVQTTTRPVHSTSEPVQLTTRPVQITAEPVQTSTRPVLTTAAPVQTTTRPVQTTAEPVQTKTRPVQTTAEPVQTTTRPVQTTAEPVQTTTRPVHTTNESLQTTAGPIQTTASTPSCPINSHYTDCIPACEPTCSHLHGPPNCNTEEPCVQGCVCDDGFVLKQRTCVPISECGCKDSHGNIHSFGEVWYGSHCSQRCECEDDGEIECEDYECDGNEICHVTEQGQHMCQKAAFSKCTIDDEPEYRTFDKMKHKFKGKDSYILVQTTNLPSNIPDVYVVTVNKKVKDKSSEEDSSEEDDDDGRLRAIRIRVYNHTVDFKKGRKIMVDGLSVRAPISPSGGIKIWDRSSRVFLKTDFGLFVEFDGKHKAEITLSHVYKIKIGGLCGNFDLNFVEINDMMKPNGEQARNVKEFGESWRVTDRRRQFFL
ncbi:zonadhesin-like [Triplophysa dalaica]|uniref:zonadhesin-like n=1 Tax=Triplophysa dalaica TaxID=1582913 RepID=UPI0024DFBBE9|nr:zonadhesin-like [Triplophysa dalaica]